MMPGDRRGSSLLQCCARPVTTGSSLLCTVCVRKDRSLHGSSDRRAGPFCSIRGSDKCKCDGTIHHGLMYPLSSTKPGSGEVLSYAEMTAQKYYTIESDGNEVPCKSADLAGDPWVGRYKQCYCKADPTKKPGATTAVAMRAVRM